MADPAPLTQDIVVYQDSTMIFEILYREDGAPVDVFDWTGDFDVAADFVTANVIHLDETNGLRFGHDGTITVTISDEHTRDLTLYDERTIYRYDLTVERPTGERMRLAMGTLTLVAAVKGVAA